MAAPQSTPLPDAPQRNESEDVFVEKANAFVAALEPFRQELQTQADFVNDQSEFIGETVNDNLTAINTVSDNIGKVNTVSGNIANVGTVADNVSDVNTVASIKSSVQTVAGVSSDVEDLAAVASDIPTVAANVSDLPAAAAMSRRMALYSRSLAMNPPLYNETLRLDYTNRAFGIGDAETGLIDEVVDFGNAHTFSRASSAWYWSANGKLVEAGPNEPRFDHDPVTGGPLGLLIEPQRTNLIPYSEDPTQTAWDYEDCAPEGTETVAGVTLSAVSTDGTAPFARIRVREGVALTGGSQYALSFLVRPGSPDLIALRGGGASASKFYVAISGLTSGNLSFSVSPGTDPELSMAWSDYKVLPSGLIYVELGLNALVDTTLAVLINVAFGDNGAYADAGAYGAFQLEDTGYSGTPSSYISTSGAAATRAADNAIRTLGDEVTGDAITIVARFTPLADMSLPSFYPFLQLEDGSSSSSGRSWQVFRNPGGVAGIGLGVRAYDVTGGNPVAEVTKSTVDGTVCVGFSSVLGGYTAVAINGETAEGVSDRTSFGEIVSLCRQFHSNSVAKYGHALSAEELKEMTTI